MATSSPPPPKVQKAALLLKSDVRKGQHGRHPGGILHATRRSPAGAGGSAEREEHAYAWVDNYARCDAAVSHLAAYGFDRQDVEFIPYSHKAAWVSKYPHAFPYVDCDAAGNVTGYPFWSPQAGSQLDIPPDVVAVSRQPSTVAALAAGGRASSAAAAAAAGGGKKAKKAGAKLAGTLLSNQERKMLHGQIHGYFAWLSERVAELETSEAGRRAVKRSGLRAPALRGLLVKLESTFGDLGKGKKRKASALLDGEDDDEDEAEAFAAPIPLLEEALLDEMGGLAAQEDESQKALRAKIKEEYASGKRVPHWEPLDFEEMFAKLVAYKEANGHPNVPVKYAGDVQLGSWVSGLRTKKKAYDLDAGKMKVDGAEENAAEPPGTPGVNAKYLTPERIQRLESIGFLWVMAKPKTKSKSWDERLEELRAFHLESGTWKVPRNTSLGEWLHNQRTLYAKRDVKFMTQRAPRMEDIGYPFDIKEGSVVSWDDRFQQLREYGRAHGNYDVPLPLKEVDDGTDDAEYDDRVRFHKWVNRLHNEYRAYEKGTPSKLNDARVERLRGIDFVFQGPKSRGRPSLSHNAAVPQLPWERRVAQLEAFKGDVGHLGIDHNYRHCSNLGGWAAEMSALHREWKAGKQQLGEDMVRKFRQLSELGFRFDVLPFYENNRSWEDHYDVLVEFRKATGSARVPLKYKADLRLGKWVQNQRQQWKLLQEGKKSKLTPERVAKLEEAGFEWVVPEAPIGVGMELGEQV
ncbi:hypothetical protein ACHAXT_001724 [Thalassiosira profunda]